MVEQADVRSCIVGPIEGDIRKSHKIGMTRADDLSSRGITSTKLTELKSFLVKASYGTSRLSFQDPASLKSSSPAFRFSTCSFANGDHINSTDEGRNQMDTRGASELKGLGSFPMFTLLPKIFSYVRKDDLANLMLVNKDFYHQAKRLLHKELAWDVHDENFADVIVKLATKDTSKTPLGHFTTYLIWRIRNSLPLESAIISPTKAEMFEEAIRCRLPEWKRAWSNIQNAEVHEANSVGDNIRGLDTLEVIQKADLTFFISLFTQDISSAEQVTLKLSPSCSAKFHSRVPSIKNLTLKITQCRETYTSAICAFEYQLAYLLLVLSTSLTNLTLLGLPKPPYLQCPSDVGTGPWGGSAGKVFEILGPRALRHVENLTIEAADTRYQAAEEAIISWISERGVYVSPLTDEEMRQKVLKAQERETRWQNQEEQIGIIPHPLSNELRKKIFGRYHHKDYMGADEAHLNCDKSCLVHGSTSGTFTAEKRNGKYVLHPNPLLRMRPPERKFRHLHLLNCPELWPAFYKISSLHPPSTLHFSAPWMDASTSDVPDSLRDLAIDINGYAASGAQLRKIYGISPSYPNFNSTRVTPGIDHSGILSASMRPSGTTAINCRKLKRKLAAYMSILDGIKAVPSATSAMSLNQVATKNMKRIEIRCMDKLSMRILENIVDWYGESLEIVGLSRLDGTHNEASAAGHVRGWAKILGHCRRLKELRVVWNIFGKNDLQDRARSEGKCMKFGIGECSSGGKELICRFSDEEWWGNGERSAGDQTRTAKNKELSSAEVGNGEGPSVPRTPAEVLQDEPTGAIPLSKSSEFRADEITKWENGKSTATQESIPVKWMMTWEAWPELKKFIPDAHAAEYLTKDAEKYLLCKSRASLKKCQKPAAWNSEKMKELLLFLMDWKYRQLQTKRASTSFPSSTASSRNNKATKQNVETTKLQQSTLLSNPKKPRRRGSFFCISDETYNIPEDVYPVPTSDIHYPFMSTDSHNAKIFVDRLREEYLAQETLLAKTIWDAIDKNIGEGEPINRAEWAARFVVKNDVSAETNSLKVPKGLIFSQFRVAHSNAYYNEWEGAFDKGETQRSGPWETALKQLLKHQPPLFAPAVYEDGGAAAEDHKLIVEHLSQFFEQINIWHRKLRLEATLGEGLKTFCELTWVMFEQVPTLERVVGLLEHGREVVAHPVRSAGKDNGHRDVEIVKIRCWSCGGGWSGDYTNINPLERCSLRVRAASRECRCQQP
ncbi:hypothetical protein BDZ91DRAFT_851514 [Kalaharituber pfeilii]|nr:hypothetical protein BDZ91DRAFT_851514 [Kalaharituber pfeilii]